MPGDWPEFWPETFVGFLANFTCFLSLFPSVSFLPVCLLLVFSVIYHNGVPLALYAMPNKVKYCGCHLEKLGSMLDMFFPCF